MNARHDAHRQDFPSRGKLRVSTRIAAPIIGLTRRAALRRAAACLRGARSVLITTHLGADPDGLGSALALASALERIGIPAHIALGLHRPGTLSLYG